MNGEINGTIEASVDVPHTNSDDLNESFEAENPSNGVAADVPPQVVHDTTSKLAPDDNSISSGLLQNLDSNDSEVPIPETKTKEEFDELPETENENAVNDVENHCNDDKELLSDLNDSPQMKSEEINEEPVTKSNDNNSHPEKDGIKDVNSSQNSEADVESEDLSELEVSEEELKTDGGASVNSDNEQDVDKDKINLENSTSPEDDNSKKSTDDVIVLETIRLDDSHDSIEVHEIESESEESPEKTDVKPETSDEPSPLRRSCRAIKRKRYTDDLENSEECDPEGDDPYKYKGRPLGSSKNKILYDPPGKIMKPNILCKQKKNTVMSDTLHDKHSANRVSEFTVYSSKNSPNINRTSNSTSNSSSSVNSSQTPSILPYLTDDMFVVEAPSFIVPYVYEKPSIKPFKEFVDTLGKELEEAKEKELLEAKKVGELKDDNNDKDADEKGEESAAEDDEGLENNKKGKKRGKKEHGKNDDDASWDGESSSDSDDDILSEEDDKVPPIKTKDECNLDDNQDIDLTKDKAGATSKSENYFDCSLGKFFTNIGYSLVQEFVQNDLLKQENRKLHRAKKSGYSIRATESSVEALKKNLELSKQNNAPYAFKMKKCKVCSFKTESDMILAHHLETPHFKNNLYKCNFCSFEVRSPHDILIHIDKVHCKTGKLERTPSCHQCSNCTFEDNGKGKLVRHLISCVRKFKPEVNLAPPIDWEPPAKIPKISKSRNSMIASYQNTFNRNQVGSNMGRALNISNLPSSINVNSTYRPRGRSPMQMSPRPMHGLPIQRGGLIIRQSSPGSVPLNSSVKNKSVHQPSISITPLPRQPQPVQSQPSQTKNSFVICEICDGYIKDLEQLRNHMQSIHKVKIHPKMIYNRPPLNCQKCQFRFFTDQGLERHLLGSHGLVTSSMQEAANKGKDAGRCPVCGRVYQWKLLNHVARDHDLTLKPAHLSYKCTVCTATFGMYKQFESHVYSAHSVVAKRVIDKSKTNTSTYKSSYNSPSLLKPINISDEITIIPQPIKEDSTKDK